jgi:hypothetical protein
VPVWRRRDESMKWLYGLVPMIVLGGASLPGLDGGKASYVSGTIVELDTAAGPVEGRLCAGEGPQLTFTPDGPRAGQPLHIEYARIRDLEYGQQAGRRVRTTVGSGVLLGPIGLLALSSKKRDHYLTIGYLDEQGRDQVVILQLGKEIVRVTLAAIEARSGKPVEYLDEEARKWGR